MNYPCGHFQDNSVLYMLCFYCFLTPLKRNYSHTTVLFLAPAPAYQNIAKGQIHVIVREKNPNRLDHFFKGMINGLVVIHPIMWFIYIILLH